MNITVNRVSSLLDMAVGQRERKLPRHTDWKARAELKAFKDNAYEIGRQLRTVQFQQRAYHNRKRRSFDEQNERTGELEPGNCWAVLDAYEREYGDGDEPESDDEGSLMSGFRRAPDLIHGVMHCKKFLPAEDQEICAPCTATEESMLRGLNPGFDDQPVHLHGILERRTRKQRRKRASINHNTRRTS